MKSTILASTVILVAAGVTGGQVGAANYEPDTLTVPVSSVVPAELLADDHYKIDDTVTVQGYMNHYSVRSDYGEFTAVGDRAMQKLLGEIIAIAQLKEMTSLSVGTDAAIGAVADTADSIVALATDPVGSINNLSAGVSRFFKRTSKAAKDVSAKAVEEVSGGDDAEAEAGDETGDEPGVTTQLASSYLGIGKAQRAIAKELQVDPYSSNQVLQAELSRVANVSGTVDKLTNILIPIPSVIGTAASVSDMVWNLNPADLLIQNQEKLVALGFEPDLIERFFESKFYSPTEQTIMVASIESMDQAQNREILLETALMAETGIEGDYFLRAAAFYAGYDKKVERITNIIAASRVPVVITESGDGLIFAALDHLLWTEEVAQAVNTIEEIMDANSTSGEQLIWIEGVVSEMAASNLAGLGWDQQPRGMDKLK
jgi:hypothetical protein